MISYNWELNDWICCVVVAEARRFFSNILLILSNLQPNHCMFQRKYIEMKKESWNTTSFMFLLLIAASFLRHNDVYKQNINREWLNIFPKTYNHTIWSTPITYYSNHDPRQNQSIKNNFISTTQATLTLNYFTSFHSFPIISLNRYMFVEKIIWHSICLISVSMCLLDEGRT